MMNKKVLVIGLGSMGKRRIRNLQFLGFQQIFGFDVREDRRKEVEELYGVHTFRSLEIAVENMSWDAWIISVPPDVHIKYMNEALINSVPSFVEASVLSEGILDLIELSKNKKVFIAPSFTLGFHPAIKQISEIIKNGSLGKISNIIYHSGQYLPDWHSYEKVSEFYVSNPLTGGAREIVPFELTWICSVFGFPNSVVAMYKKTVEIDGASEIDDTYNCLMEFPDFLLNMTVDVVSRKAKRNLIINGDLGQLEWNWDKNEIIIYKNESTKEVFSFDVMEAQLGYNKNITEEIYINEINAFQLAAFEGESYPNNLENDLRILGLLEALELSYNTKTFVSIK
jgi:predicted dehydrogenase